MSRKDPIFSDDPEALIKLEIELRECREQQAWWTKINKIVRAARKAGDIEGGVAKQMALGQKEHNARSLYEPDFMGRYGYPDYLMANNNGNMGRIKKRIAALAAKETA